MPRTEVRTEESRPVYKKPEPKVIDTRSFTPSAPPRPATTPNPAPTYKPSVPQPILDKKPHPNISLNALKSSTDNQRKPDQKNISALRDALSVIMKEEPKSHSNPSTPPQTQARPTPRPEPKPSTPPQTQTKSPEKVVSKNGPTPEELKKILGAE